MQELTHRRIHPPLPVLDQILLFSSLSAYPLNTTTSLSLVTREHGRVRGDEKDTRAFIHNVGWLAYLRGIRCGGRRCRRGRVHDVHGDGGLGRKGGRRYSALLLLNEVLVEMEILEIALALDKRGIYEEVAVLNRGRRGRRGIILLSG